MEAIIAFFLTPWIFYSTIILIIFLEVIFAAYEKFRWNTWIFIIGAVLLHLYSAKYWNQDLLSIIADHPIWTVVAIVGYFASGVVWSFLKWTSKVSANNRRIKRILVDYEAGDKNDDGHVHQIKNRILNWAGHNYTINEAIKKSFPKVIDNKGNIVGWIVWWPFSMVGTIFTDPLRRIGVFLYELFGTWYQAIVDRMVNKLSVPEPQVEETDELV